MDRSQAAADIFNKRAKHYQDKFMDLHLYHDTFDFFCSHVTTQNANVLELACGPGNITKYLLKKRPDFKILGTDLAPNMTELAGISNPTAEFKVMDCRHISGIKEHYNALMCGFGLPYLSKEEAVQLISDTAKLLEPSGIIYFSTMEEDETNQSGIKTSASTGDQIYITYHRADYLTDALIKNGFEILKLKRQEYPEQNGSKTTDLIIIAQKN